MMAFFATLPSSANRAPNPAVGMVDRPGLLQAPKGRARWTLRLLENKVVELGIVERASDSTIGRTVKKTVSSRITGNAGSSRRRPTAPS